MEERTPVLEMRDIVKVYPDGTKALKGVTIKVYEGEILGLLGENGAGKTTLLKLIAGLDRPDRGEVIVDGYNLNMLDDLGLSLIRNTVVAYIPQDYGLIPEFTVWENVELPLLIAGIDRSEREKKIYEVLEYMGLTAKIKAYPRKLSGGEKQRVAIARALVTTPTVLLADEPTANLDWENAVRVAELLHKVRDDFGTTVILVTHDPRLLEYVDRSMNLIDGVLKDKEGLPYARLH
jgi:putative ABC transport system ATP-binding protein